MGRHRKIAPVGKLRLIYPTKNFKEDKEYTLSFEYNWLDNAPVRRDTGYRVKVRDWNKDADNKRGELRSSYSRDFDKINGKLKKQLRKYDEMLLDYAEKHPNKVITIDDIRAVLKGESIARQDEGQDFVDYTLKVLRRKFETNKIGKSRFENGVSAMKGFSLFLTEMKRGTYRDGGIYLGDISRSLVDDYIVYRKTSPRHKNSDATINHTLTPIIQACNQASEEGLLDFRIASQIKDSRIPVQKSLNEEEYNAKALSNEELNALIHFYKTDTEPRRQEYIEMYLFAFYACGMRMVDVMTLMWASIDKENKILKKTMVKTSKVKKPKNLIPLSDQAISILDKWEKKHKREKFVFDLVEDTFDPNDKAKLYSKRNTCNKKINQALKVVGKKIGLSIELTFHSARHTFAVLALNSGTPLSKVSRYLGHSSTELTEQIYAEYLPTTLQGEMNRLSKDIFPKLDL